MLNEQDIEYMRQADADIRVLREVTVTLKWTVEVPGEPDPWTGEPTDSTTEEKSVEVPAVVTEVTTDEHVLESGIAIEKGDIIVDVRSEVVPTKPDVLRSVTYADEDYTVIGADRRGIGAYVRLEMVGRLTNGQS